MPPSSVGADTPRGGRRGWVLGIVIAVIVVVVIAAATFAYLKFFRTAPVASTAAATPATSALATSSAVVAANGSPIEMVAPTSAGAGAVPQSGVPTASAPLAVAPQAAPPIAPTQPGTSPAGAPVAPAAEQNVDEVNQVAGLVAKGQTDYARGRYTGAIINAKAALAIQPDDAGAQQLLQQATDAQRRVAAKRTQERTARAQREQAQQQAAAAQQAAAEAAAARAAAAAQAAKAPTPDQIYNERAHSECKRGLFGKFCRHRIRKEVCQGVQAGAPGTTVCNKDGN